MNVSYALYFHRRIYEQHKKHMKIQRGTPARPPFSYVCLCSSYIFQWKTQTTKHLHKSLQCGTQTDVSISSTRRACGRRSSGATSSTRSCSWTALWWTIRCDTPVSEVVNAIRLLWFLGLKTFTHILRMYHNIQTFKIFFTRKLSRNTTKKEWEKHLRLINRLYS